MLTLYVTPRRVLSAGIQHYHRTFIRKVFYTFPHHKKALERLNEALNDDLSKSGIVVDGTIQRFEFTFKLAWKLGKAILNHNGIEVETPRLVIKEAFKAKMIQNGQGRIDMLEDRNKISYIYDEAEALKIYKKIKQSHFKLLQDFNQGVSNLK